MTEYERQCIRWRAAVANNPGFRRSINQRQVANNIYMQNLYAQQYDYGAHLAAIKAEERERAAMYGMEP